MLVGRREVRKCVRVGIESYVLRVDGLPAVKSGSVGWD